MAAGHSHEPPGGRRHEHRPVKGHAHGHAHDHAHGHAHDHGHALEQAFGQLHGHGHGHAHGAGASSSRRLALTLALVLVYMLAEVAGGLLSGSLALLADAGHMLSDAAALALSLFALWIARKPATPRRSYGYYRAEILAALANGATLVAVSVFILLEAWQRLREPPPVEGGLMMGIAAGGLFVNLMGLWLLGEGRSENLNMRGAWLHVLTDALGSFQAIVAGALIWVFDWHFVDPIASILIGLLVIFSAWSLLREATSVLMEGTPEHIDLDDVRDAILEIPGICSVHDLHVWTITSGLVSLSAHIGIKDAQQMPKMISSVREVLSARFGIVHTTIQPELEGQGTCPGTC